MSAPNRALPVVGLLLLSCSASPGPENVLTAVTQAAQAGHTERFLAGFEARSKACLGLFYSVSRRYGYLGHEDLCLMADLEVLESEQWPVEGGKTRARLAVSDGLRQGALCFVTEDGAWKIDLFAGADCSGRPPPAAATE